MSRKNTSPDPPGEDIFLTSSPCWQPQYTFRGHGFVFHLCGRFSASYSFAFFQRLLLRLQAAGGNCQPWFYLRLVAYGFFGLSEEAYGGGWRTLNNSRMRVAHPSPLFWRRVGDHETRPSAQGVSVLSSNDADDVIGRVL